MKSESELNEAMSRLADEIFETSPRLRAVRGMKAACQAEFLDACHAGTKQQTIAAGVNLIRANVKLSQVVNQREALSYRIAQLALEHRRGSS